MWRAGEYFGSNAFVHCQSAENYALELCERNVEDNKWNEAGGIMTLATDGLYRAYGDLSAGGFEVGTGSDPTGAEYLFSYWVWWPPAKTRFRTVPVKDCGIGLKGHYYFYYGTAITTPCESTNCTDPAGSLVMSGWNTEIGNPSQIFARAPTPTPYRVEVAVPLSLLGLSAGSVNNWLWAYFGGGHLQPERPEQPVRQRMYRFAQGRGVEYDTLRYEFEETTTTIPEPATLLLVGSGLAAAGVRRYRRRTSFCTAR